MRPYSRRDLQFAGIIFNYRLSRTRKTVECTFGSLVKELGIFGKQLETVVQLAKASIKSACILHSFIKKEETETDRLMEELQKLYEYEIK
jgi:hypothetical protein